MKMTLFLLLFILTMFSCSQKSSTYGTLTGTIKNIKNDTILCLIDNDNDSIVQKFLVKNGHFKIKFSAPVPKLFTLRPENYKYEKDFFDLWLDNSPTKLYGNIYNMADSRIEGSVPNKIYDIYKSIEYNYRHELTKINLKKHTNDKHILDSLDSELKILQSDYKDKLMKFFTGNISTEVAFNYIFFETARYKSALNRIDLKHLYDLLPDKFRNSKNGIIIKTYISLPAVPKNGDMYIDFSQPNPEGELNSISSNLGKYTILEFWGSFCGSCRAEHPALRQQYRKYHKKGLNIIGISGDVKISDWVDAIRKDSIPWINISDLGGYNNYGFMLYGVKAIPCLILLDKNGIILDDNFGSKIDGELKKFFEK